MFRLKVSYFHGLCWAVSGEYADKGHGAKYGGNDYTRNVFINNNLDDYGNVRDAYDVSHAARRLGLNVSASGKIRSGSDWESLGANIKMGNEVSVNYGSHWVNLTSITIGEKLRLFGGGTKTSLINTTIWNPLEGLTIGPNSIDKFVLIQY